MPNPALFLPLLMPVAQGPIPFDRAADWESYTSGVTTGGAFADIDGDGHLDMVVANGNDIQRQRVEVYYGDGAGNFPTSPQWQSNDIDYHGHLSVGDINGDGLPDVAVAVFLGAGGFGSFGHTKVYFNQGTALESTPSWQSADSYYTFANALGDADGDGDLDLAVAVGEPYYGAPKENRVYFNQGGSLQTTPSWVASAPDHSLDAAFADVDGDGDLDLAFTTAGSNNKVYFQVGGMLQTTPGWSSTDNANQNGNSCSFGDVDGDGDLDFLVSDNNQLSGGAGVFKVYRNHGSGLETTPFWSDFEGYVSAVVLADLHLDGAPEVIGGSWWGGVEIYANASGTPSGSPDWDSQENSVVEAMFLGDVDEKELRVELAETHPGNGSLTLFYLGHRHLQSLEQVRADGVALNPDDYCWDRENGWISVAAAPFVSLEVDYTWSESLDLGVTNWDGSVGNLLFLRAPLVEVAMTEPGSASYSPGQAVAFDGHWTNTTNRNQVALVAAAGFPAVGGMRILDYHAETLAPFATLDLAYTLPLPSNLPSGFFGNTTVAVAVIVDGEAVEQASDTFLIQ